MRKASAVTAILLALAIGIAGLAVNQSTSRSSQDSPERPVAARQAAAAGSISNALSRDPSSTTIITQDLDRTVAWYRASLGFREIAQRSYAQQRIAVLERNGTLLKVREDNQKALSAGADQSATSQPVGLEVWVEDVDHEARRLQERGIEFLTHPRNRPDGGFRGALIRDIDGRLIGLRESLSSR